MPTPDSSREFQSSAATRGTSDDRSDRLAEVRAELAALVAEVKGVAEARASQVKQATIEGAEAGVDIARETIRSHPIPAVAIAAIVGAAIAVALTPAPRQARSARQAAWVPDSARSNLAEMAHGLQRTATSRGSSLLSAFERVVDSVSTVDPKSSLTPALEKAGAWLNSVRGFMSGK